MSKANLALSLMGICAEDVPEGITFVEAQKLRNGGVVLQLNTAQAASWIQQDGAIRLFLTQMGGMSIHKSQLSHVIVEYVPISFDPNGMGGACNSGSHKWLESWNNQGSEIH